ncbi:DNA internalization-related competence protein ComEC/Rec2 [Geopsychrobacter electrodiphilus]|uniref:DNA internalization-related competence protein ComEC/Rec2 n=1 Tax=Geopsychrobacter electrodiphilus TaxID=225196 RepID=UPI00036854AB|nr:DNA internalization-related competence protein ComEC/Rec2 [Geopsychrobacter electrodiphilus]
MNLVGVCFTAYVGGLLLAQYLDLPALPLFCCCALLFVLLLLRKKTTLTLCLFLLFCLLTGLLRYPLHLSVPIASSFDRLVAQGPLRVEARVLWAEERPDKGQVVDLEVLKLNSRAVLGRPGLRLRLSIGTSDGHLPVGSLVMFRSRLQRTRNFGIPGEFNYARHLAHRHIWYTAYLSDSGSLARFAGTEKSIAAKIGAIRLAGLDFLDAALSHDRALLLKGLLLGEKGAMSTSLRTELAAGGISHLFAISGLHLGLLAFFLYGLFRFIYSRSTHLLLWQPPARVLWILILPVLFLYLLLTGDALATQRAFYMLLIVSGLLLFRRRTDPLCLLMTLAFLFLLLDPLALWQPSFLLSFSGVFGILLWQGPLQELCGQWPVYVRYPTQLFLMSCAAFIATLPVIVLIFHLFAPAGLLTNLLAIPLVGFISLPVGLFGLLLSPILPHLGQSILQIAAWVLQQVLAFATWSASLPGFLSRPVYLTLWENLAVLLGSLALLWGWKQPKILILILPAIGLLSMPLSGSKTAELTMFSVGQGEAILLRVEGKTILIDGGGLRSDSFDVGERLLAPALGRLGISSLDAIILTHDHPDHSGGLKFIIDTFDVHEFWSSQPLASLNPDLRQSLITKGLVVRQYAQPEWRLQPVGGLDSLFLFTPPETAQGLNNQSLCVYLFRASGGVLLTGDLESQGVDALIRSAIPGVVTVLKAPHHGSAGSQPARLVAQLRPKIVLVSVGYQNPYHFPSEQLLDQAMAIKAQVFRTDLDGSIRVRNLEGDWQVSHWGKGLFH